MTDPIATDLPVAPTPASPVVAPAAPTPPAAPSVSLPTEAFNERIAQAKRNAEAELLKSLGVTDVAAAQAAIKAANDLSEKNKTDAQRVTELTAQLAAEKERGDVYEETLKARAASELESLPEAQRAAVLALAGDDAGAQILAIDTLKPTWSPQAASAAVAAPATAPATPPAAGAPNTAPPRVAPPPTPGGQPDAYQTYLALKAKNPFAAANYRRSNAAAVAAGETKQT